MIDQDVSFDNLRVLASQAIREYPTAALFPMLKDTNQIVRTLTARELQIRGGEEVFLYAIEMIKAPRFEHREIAAFLLGQLGTPNLPYRDRSIPILSQLLNDDYYEVVSAAVAALGHLKASEVIDDILNIAFHEEDYVRENVAFALSHLKLDKVSIKALRKLKNDNNPDVREWAIYALKRKE
jgi:HEAT repeat protein